MRLQRRCRRQRTRQRLQTRNVKKTAQKWAVQLDTMSSGVAIVRDALPRIVRIRRPSRVLSAGDRVVSSAYDDQLHRTPDPADAGCRDAGRGALLHRHGRRPGVRAAGPHARRRRVRNLPLSDASPERARLLLLARSRHRQDYAAVGVVRHQIADRVDRRASGQVHDLVRAAALLRSDARTVAQGAFLSRRRSGRGRRSSIRSSTSCFTSIRVTPASAGSTAATARTRRTATARASSSRSPRWSPSISIRVPTRPRTIFSATISRRSNRASTAWSGRPSDRFRRTRSGSSSRCCTSRRCEIDMVGVDVEPLRLGQPQKTFTEDDLHVRHFMRGQSRRLIRKGQFRAA